MEKKEIVKKKIKNYIKTRKNNRRNKRNCEKRKRNDILFINF